MDENSDAASVATCLPCSHCGHMPAFPVEVSVSQRPPGQLTYSRVKYLPWSEGCVSEVQVLLTLYSVFNEEKMVKLFSSMLWFLVVIGCSYSLVTCFIPNYEI